MNRNHIRAYKHNAKVQWSYMNFWEKLTKWKLSYIDFERHYVEMQLQNRYWKYGNYK